jgi:lipoate-protein ligase A
MQGDVPLRTFWAALKDFMFTEYDMKEYVLSEDEKAQVAALHKDIYSKWEWNYGASPDCNIQKKRRIEGVGSVQVYLDVAKEGIIKDAYFYGDFFGADDIAELQALLKGRRFEYGEISGLLENINISRYLNNMDNEAFLSLLFA